MLRDGSAAGVFQVPGQLNFLEMEGQARTVADEVVLCTKLFLLIT